MQTTSKTGETRSFLLTDAEMGESNLPRQESEIILLPSSPPSPSSYPSSCKLRSQLENSRPKNMEKRVALLRNLSLMFVLRLVMA